MFAKRIGAKGKTQRRPGTLGALVAALLIVVPTPSPASASVGGDTYCGNTEYCISKRYNSPNSYDPNMTYGWTVDWWNSSIYGLNSQNFSNWGGRVAGNVRSIRNRNGMSGATMCIYESSTPPNYLTGQAKYYGQTWVPLSYSNRIASAVFKRLGSQLNCPGSI